jgi:hypothetical protein
MQGIENIYRPALETAQARLSAIEERLSLAKAAKGSREELKAFDAKSRVEQVHELYPDGAPKSRELRERHQVALDEVSSVSEPKELERAAALHEALNPEPKISMYDGESLTRETTPAQAADKAAKVDALVERNTAGQTIKQHLESLSDFAIKQGKVSVQYLPTQPLRDRGQGLFTTLDASSNSYFRGLNFALHEAPQGGFIPKKTAAAYQNEMLRRIQSAEKVGYQEGFEAWSIHNGRNPKAALLNIGGHKAEFDQEVFLKIFNPEREVAPGVEQAADAHRNGFALALNMRRDAGEAGFGTIKERSNYIPIIFDSNKISHLKNQTGVGRDKMVTTLSKSYQEGRLHLEVDCADKMAEMQIRRAESHMLSGNQVFKNVVSAAEQDAFV